MVATLSVATLVPNHLSTVKNYQSTPSISHPKSTKPPKKTLSKSKTTPEMAGKRKREWQREGKR